MYLYGIKSKYNPKREKINIVYQNYHWDCWLASTLTVLNKLNISYCLEEILFYLYKNNLKYSTEYGAFFTYIPLILKLYSVETIVYVPQSRLFEYEFGKKIIEEVNVEKVTPLRKKLECANSPREFLYNSLYLLLQSEYKIFAFKDDMILRKELFQCVFGNELVIVQVECSEFYGIQSDDSEHMVILEGEMERNNLILIDVYEKLAEACYVEWGKMREHACKYNWNLWSSWMLKII